MTVDPKVYALAETFIEDLMPRVFRFPLQPFACLPPRDILVARIADAMQRAIDDESEAIVQELMP